MKLNLSIFFIMILVWIPLYGSESNNCIKLENVNLGCFPSEDHGCFQGIYSNAEEDLPEPIKYNCKFYKGLKIHLENTQAGPLPWRCATPKPGSPCANPEYSGICTPDQCQTAADPVCQQKCASCVDDTLIRFVQYRPLGCQIISDGSGGAGPSCRTRCADEPYWQGLEYHGSDSVPAKVTSSPDCSKATSIPSGYIGYSGAILRCNGINPCPQYVKQSNSGWQEVPQGTPGSRKVKIIGVTDPKECTLQQPEPPETYKKGLSCPWQNPFGKVRTGCEPIPDACKWPPIPGAGSCDDFIKNRGN